MDKPVKFDPKTASFQVNLVKDRDGEFVVSVFADAHMRQCVGCMEQAFIAITRTLTITLTETERANDHEAVHVERLVRGGGGLH